jgi:hypothetical protein
MSPQTPQPESVDYTGAPLRVGQNVTFVEDDQERSGSRLYTGELKLIGQEQIVVESGGKLFIVRGREESQPRAYRFVTVLGLPSPGATGGS